MFCFQLLASVPICLRLLSTTNRNIEATGRIRPFATWAKMITAKGLKPNMETVNPTMITIIHIDLNLEEF